MKKSHVLSMIAIAVVLCMVPITFSGCQPEQVKVVAQNAGLFSAVGWIAYDDPTTNEIAAVASILDVIEANAGEVEAGATYTEVLYPEIVKVINKDVEAQYRPLAKAGGLSLLSGLDMLFASKPEWKDDEEMVLKVVELFVLGAKNGLSMSEKDAIMIEARAVAQRRAAVNREIRAMRALEEVEVVEEVE